MGGGSWTSSSWSTYSTSHVLGKTDSELFPKTTIDSGLDPKNVSVRESRDSIEHPNSTAIAIFIDVTGSMGKLSSTMVKTGCDKLATEIHKRGVITDPHIMFGAVGDVHGDTAPLQVSQFESDLRIVEQLQKFFIEGGGMESYSFPWYFMSMHSIIDCFEKRNKKGYIFTVGDDGPEMFLSSASIKKYLGYDPEKDFTAEELLTMISRTYEVFHLIVKEGSTCSNTVIKSWQNLLGERAIILTDHTKMSEVIVSIIQSLEGISKNEIINSWSEVDGTSLVVSNAIKNITTINSTGDIITF